MNEHYGNDRGRSQDFISALSLSVFSIESRTTISVMNCLTGNWFKSRYSIIVLKHYRAYRKADLKIRKLKTNHSFRLNHQLLFLLKNYVT